MSNPKGYRESRRFIARKRGFHAYFRRPRHTRSGEMRERAIPWKTIGGLSTRAIVGLVVARAFENWEGSRRRNCRRKGGNVPTNGIDPSVVAVAWTRSQWPSIRDVKKERIDLNYSRLWTTRCARNHFARLREERDRRRHSTTRLINDPGNAYYCTRNQTGN